VGPISSSFKTGTPALARLCVFFLVSAAGFAADSPVSLLQKAEQTMDKSGDLDTDRTVSLLKRAISDWQTASSKDPAYARALDYLAVVLMAQIRSHPAARDENGLSDFNEWIKRAGPYTKQALEICEANPAAPPEDLAFALELQAQGQEAAGAQLWARAAKIRSQQVEALNAGSAAFSTEDTVSEPPAEPPAEGATQPVAVSKQVPDYTAVARIALYRGKVTLRAMIGPDGKVHNVRLVRGLGFGLDEQAARAAYQWVYRPATKDGTPVAAPTELYVNFEIR
jgi:TonB family protein